MLILTNELKERFCKECRIPITIFTNHIFLKDYVLLIRFMARWLYGIDSANL